MNKDKNNATNEESESAKKKHSYIKWIVFYATALLLIILVVNFDSIGATLGSIFSVITPVFYGAVIAYLCNPVFVFFHKKVFKKIKSIRWRKALSLFLTYLIVLIVIFTLLFVVADQIIQSVEKFIANLDGYIQSAENFIINLINKIRFPSPDGIDPSISDITPPDSGIMPQGDITGTLPSDTAEEKINLIDFSFTKEGLINMVHNFLDKSGDAINAIGNAIIESGTATVIFVFNIFLGFIFSIYMLAEKDLIIAKAKKFAYAYLPKDKADSLCQFGNYTDEKVGHFIKGKLIESVIVGSLAYVVFLIFKIPAPLMIAVIVAVMNIIPIFGPFLGAVPAALLVLIMDPPKTIPYIIIVVLIMQINGNYISPKIVGKRTGLTPLGAIVALTLMSGYFGIIGMFIGIPLCAIVVETLWHQSNKRLEEKSLSTDLATYYPSGALIETDDGKPHNITAIIVNFFVSVFCKIFRINRKKNRDKNIDGTSEG